jgi:intracellular sulfur oxidation DsrE/DsrF family protein
MERRVPAILALTIAAALSPALGGAGVGLGSGPIIDGFGPTFAVPSPDFAIPADETLRVVFDVAETQEPGGRANPKIESAARFLNMHARAGVDADRIHVAVVIHGAASRDVLSNPAYRARFERDNPNLALLTKLQSAGVEIILCGQTAMHRGYARADLAGGVQLALSAMTALAVLQNDGYALIAF